MNEVPDMSMKDRLEKKTAGIVKAAMTSQSDMPSPAESGQQLERTPKIEQRPPRTGPGQMLAFRSHMQESTARLQELEDKLSRFDGSLPVRRIDPLLIVPSKWANRHSTSFSSVHFHELRREIESANGNVQPILVRPINGPEEKYEIVFGHRRHQACLELNLPVLSLIEEVTDRELFSLMDRENRSRADLSPFEQGEMYRRALDDGLFTSLRALAADVGADPGNVSKAISIARLPGEILAAFDSPSNIQYRWVSLLNKALEKDADGVLTRARAISLESQKRTPNEVIDILTGQSRKLRATTVDIRREGKSIGRIKRATDGSVLISLKPGALPDDDFKRLQDSVESIVLGNVS